MTRPLRVTVCELHDDRAAFARDWTRLAAHVQDHKSELVLLPEMPFSTWLASSPAFVPASWNTAVRAHEEWLPRLTELAPASVISSRPVTRAGRRLNEGFAWSADDGYRAIHDKCFLPDETGYWEAKWYEAGDRAFDVTSIAGARLGLLICTELWALDRARQYGKAGAEILATPRATGRPTVDKWITGGRAAAIVSGAFSLSSNWTANAGGGDFGGAGWIVDPDGHVLAQTSLGMPFQTLSIDLAAAEAARNTYPRYALE
jgi:N-carbamoylputrescine amidase